MNVKLDRKLNLVIPLQYGETTVYVHSTPMGREAFEANYLLVAKTFSRMHAEGLNAVSGPRVAYMILKETAIEDGRWEGPTGASTTLVAEVVRLSNVLMPVEGKGWETIPLQEAIGRKLLDEDDVSEVMNAIVFFTVASSMYPRREQTALLTFALNLWGGRLEPSGFTAFASSLKTSTPPAATATKESAVSSVPH